jgi:hypothetical protein
VALFGGVSFANSKLRVWGENVSGMSEAFLFFFAKVFKIEHTTII